MADSTTQNQQSEETPDSLYERVITFFRKLKVEWGKINFPDYHWPKGDQWENSNRGELWRMTIGVFVFTTVVTLIVVLFSMVVDPVFSFFDSLF